MGTSRAGPKSALRIVNGAIGDLSRLHPTWGVTPAGPTCPTCSTTKPLKAFYTMKDPRKPWLGERRNKTCSSCLWEKRHKHQ